MLLEYRLVYIVLLVSGEFSRTMKIKSITFLPFSLPLFNKCISIDLVSRKYLAKVVETFLQLANCFLFFRMDSAVRLYISPRYWLILMTWYRVGTVPPSCLQSFIKLTPPLFFYFKSAYKIVLERVSQSMRVAGTFRDDTQL